MILAWATLPTFKEAQRPHSAASPSPVKQLQNKVSAIAKGLRISYASILEAHFQHNEQYAQFRAFTNADYEKPFHTEIYSGTFEPEILFCDHVRHLGVEVMEPEESDAELLEGSRAKLNLKLIKTVAGCRSLVSVSLYIDGVVDVMANCLRTALEEVIEIKNEEIEVLNSYGPADCMRKPVSLKVFGTPRDA